MLREGALPPKLMNLPARWGMAADGLEKAQVVIPRGTARKDEATPEQAPHSAPHTAELLSDTGGLTQFGAFTETLPPGSKSSYRHWHETEDEFLYVLNGTPTVVENDGPHILVPARLPAGPRAFRMPTMW